LKSLAEFAAGAALAAALLLLAGLALLKLSLVP
jgi:hypothetical protein